ncbi:hypothetical protein C5167_002790 [Papaver somniferum]|uniref:Uncharacterized protein n=1 Tax=Papaver somniferum TaxID=3469 RepID=A0A4Y7L2Z2_PAPSO|nr:hypothetical protein C5167_002790 [Papaver somniferum]
MHAMIFSKPLKVSSGAELTSPKPSSCILLVSQGHTSIDVDSSEYTMLSLVLVSPGEPIHGQVANRANNYAKRCVPRTRYCSLVLANFKNIFLRGTCTLVMLSCFLGSPRPPVLVGVRLHGFDWARKDCCFLD